MEFVDRDPIPKWDFQEPSARLEHWLRVKSVFWRHDTSTLLHKESNCSTHLLSERLVEDWQSCLEAKFEEQVEVAFNDATRTSKGTH